MPSGQYPKALICAIWLRQYKLQLPYPDVIDSIGWSQLIFELRVWVHVNESFTVTWKTFISFRKILPNGHNTELKPRSWPRGRTLGNIKSPSVLRCWRADTFGQNEVRSFFLNQALTSWEYKETFRGEHPLHTWLHWIQKKSRLSCTSRLRSTSCIQPVIVSSKAGGINTK